MSGNLNVKVLDKKKLGKHIWVLCKVSLFDYLSMLKEDFYSFAIQRKIVKNQYLDSLYLTVKSGDPIPSITLTNKGQNNIDDSYFDNIGAFYNLDMANVEILDGLQRTFRLWGYFQLNKVYQNLKREFTPDLYGKYHIDSSYIAKELKINSKILFDTGVISHKLINKINLEIGELENILNTYEIIITLWLGLDDKEVIQKMLLLNAGHKPMSKTHQFELLFLQIYDQLQGKTNVVLIKENELSSSKVKGDERSLGYFMFSSIIISLQSLVQGKPVRVSTEKLIEEEFDEENSVNIYNKIFDFNFLTWFLKECVYVIDKSIFEANNVEAIKWISKDTSLSGFFSAIGSGIDFENLDQEKIIHQVRLKVESLVDYISNGGLRIDDFNEEYKKLSSMSINIGTVIRTIIYEHFKEVLLGKRPNWKHSFEYYSKNRRVYE